MLEWLKNIRCFSELDDASLRALGEATQERTFAPGEALCREGEAGDRMFIIDAGEVAVLKSVQDGKRRLSPETAEVIANAMKDWAIQKGATHFTHWFQPLTGYTAEKHDSFISPNGDGSVLLEFS